MIKICKAELPLGVVVIEVATELIKVYFELKIHSTLSSLKFIEVVVWLLRMSI